MCIDVNRQAVYNTGILGEGPSISGRPPRKGEMTMPASKAQQRAVTKYVKNRYDRFGLTMPKGRLDGIKAAAAAQGESVNGFINAAIDEKMERDTTGGSSEAAGEELPVFVTRAVETQAQRDSLTRKMKKAPDKKSEA